MSVLKTPEVDPEILVGTLRSPYQIKTKEKGVIDIENWDYRALWSFLRFHYPERIRIKVEGGKTKTVRKIDQRIHDHIEAEGRTRHDKEYVQLTRSQRAEILDEYFETLVSTKKMNREMQFIVNDKKIRAVASLQHLLIPPTEVYEITKDVMATKFPQYDSKMQEGLTGLHYQVQEYAGFNVGLQVYGGDIFTRQAITMSSWLRVLSCFNPLSWLGSGSFNSLTGSNNGSERMLRIKKITDLKPRLIDAIEAQLKNTAKLEKQVDDTKKVKVKRTDAEIIMAALGLSYNLGANTVKQVIEKLKSEEQSQWGMAMASSWVAEHGDLRKQSRDVKQKLSTISGAALLLKDVQKSRERSLQWLNGHVKKGQSKSLDDLAAIIKDWELKRK